MFCRNCGREHDNLAVVCMNCGVAVGTGNNFCPNCGVRTNPGLYVCSNCGITLCQTQIAAEQKSKNCCWYSWNITWFSRCTQFLFRLYR